MVVRMRRNTSQTAKRRSHHAISAVRTSKCECGASRASHRACPECGRYRGRVVIDIVARKKRDERRSKRRQTELRESGQATESAKEEKATPSS
ncbi:MAG: 50S ribosomal protein L32 [bacterium]|nr:50S ribosomal protein L32 [bacterium]